MDGVIVYMVLGFCKQKIAVSCSRSLSSVFLSTSCLFVIAAVIPPLQRRFPKARILQGTNVRTIRLICECVCGARAVFANTASLVTYCCAVTLVCFVVCESSGNGRL